MTDLSTDLNATIRSAVQARIEASVAEALAGGELIGEMVRAALNQPVEVSKPGSSYAKERVPFIRDVLWKTIQKATQEAVQRMVAEEQPRIEEEVRKVLKRQAPEFAAGLVSNLVERTNSAYGVAVTLRMPSE